MIYLEPIVTGDLGEDREELFYSKFNREKQESKIFNHEFIRYTEFQLSSNPQDPPLWLHFDPS